MIRTAIAALLALGLTACGDDSPAADAAPSIDAPPNVGTMSASWTITDEEGNPLDCDDVAALTVSMVATAVGAGAGIPNAFPCGEGQGSAELPPDTYDVRVELRAGAGTLAGPLAENEVVVEQSSEADLGELVFEVSPRGGLIFTVDTPSTGDNCAAEGGDLTAITMELRDADDTCIPTTFEIGDGADTTGGTYESDCEGASWGCIENDQEVSVSDTRSGPRRLVITGQRGGIDDCYHRTAQFNIPGNDLVRDLFNQSLQENEECEQEAP